MGQSGPQTGSDRSSNPDHEAVPDKVIISPIPIDSVSDVSSIDKLLELADGDEWNIDAQVRSLQIAAVDPSRDAAAAERARGPSLAPPTPFDLGPAGSPLTTPSKGPPPLPKASISGSIPAVAKKSLPPPLPRPPDQTGPQSRKSIDIQVQPPGTLVDLLTARITSLEGSDDKVGLARAQIELSIAAEAILGDDARSMVHAEAALKIDPRLAAAHAILRRKRHGRGAIAAMLGHLEHELAAATEETATVEFLVEKARLLGAANEKPEVVRAVWEQALKRDPHHAGALKGLETELATRTYAAIADAASIAEANQSLAEHLGRMADAYVSEPRLAAWLHAERAQILEWRLRNIDAARGALERAVSLDPSVGPVRSACVRHVAAHNDAAAAVVLLDHESRIETDPQRAARLELDAACIASEKLNDRSRALGLLTRAAGRAPTTTIVDRRVLDELIRLHEDEGHWQQSARARRARLPYFVDPEVIVFELRSLAQVHERLDEPEVAIGHVQHALSLDPADMTLLELLDRLLASVQRDEDRVKLWVSEASRLEDATKRARALGRAAAICENNLARPLDAIRHLRAAWVASPGDSEVLDNLARLLTPAPSEVVDHEARGLVDLYAQAVESARDPGRKVAYLEKIALMWEEVVGEPRRAARVYEEILKIEPDRRGAVIGLGRCAARVGDDRALARALLDEARLESDGVDVLTLRIRAATALGRVDPARALSLVDEVLEQDSAHPAARVLETRLHEDAGRWERAAESMRARIQYTLNPKDKIALWLALAQLENIRLRDPRAALASLQAARAIDPSHPVPPEQILRMLDSGGDNVLFREAVEALAKDAPTAEERVRHLLHAAEIDELRIGDDARAAMTYARAMSEAPEEDLISERLERVLVRRAATAAKATEQKPAAQLLAELIALQQKRLERARTPVAERRIAFDLAQLLIEAGRDLPHATQLLERVLGDEPKHIAALRAGEVVTRRSGDWVALSRMLSQQGDAFQDTRARLGALWSLAGLEEWRLPVGESGQTYARILRLDASDPGALEATVRREIPAARHGDLRARRSLISALRSLFAFASDDGTRLAIQLRLATLLESFGNESPDITSATTMGILREAHDRFRAALHIDSLSVTSATGLARIAPRLQDAEGAFAAASSLAELSVNPRARARYLLDAAEILLRAGPDERLGKNVDRRAKACLLLERAIDTDPDSIPAAGRLATVRQENGESEKIVDTFRNAIKRARAAESIVLLGSEIARVARDELNDLPLGIEAMRRVREVAPTHAPSLLTLAELCIAQRSWPEAVDALESVVNSAREDGARLTALFALASIYEHVLARPNDAEDAIRKALDIDPGNARALKALLRHITSVRNSSMEDLSREEREEVATLLERLTNVEREPAQRCDLLLQLADIRNKLGDKPAVEIALIEATAQNPASVTAFARLASCFRTPPAIASDPWTRDHVGHARALAQVIGRGAQLGKVDARWFAALGQIEIESLGRVRDGITHLQQAVKIDPDMHEVRLELAKAFTRASAHDEASRVLVGMLAPQGPPGEESTKSAPMVLIKEPAAALSMLEQSLGAERRSEEALVTSELRAVAGDLDEGRLTWLRARRLPPVEQHHAQLDRPTLVTHVLPPEGRHVLLEVAAAMAGMESKILRADLTEIGISARDRISPRTNHPTRALLDRLAKTLGLADIDLVITPAVTRTRVLALDTLWIVCPRSLTDLPEPQQAASLARALARIAFGVPWLEELPPPHIEAFLIACARQAVHGYAADDVDVLSSKLVAQYEPSVARNLSRKQKKLLDELAPHIAAPQGRPIAVDVFISALARAELRAAMLLTGDLLATLDEMRTMDPHLFHATERPGIAALTGYLDHPFAGDVIRFALTSEAVGLRRRIGTTWTG